MLKIGITGGIGSGKTTVCKVFEAIGIPIYYADDRAKYLMRKDKKLIASITELFGEEAYLKDGNLNRKYLAGIVFENKLMLKKLEALVHPAVHLDGEHWHKKQKKAPYTLREAALLFENGSYKKLDKTITVYAPKKMRISRVMKRDKVTRKAVVARMKNQMLDREKRELANYVIKNDCKHPLIMQVLKIHKKIMNGT